MAIVELERLFEQVKHLTAQERNELRNRIDAMESAEPGKTVANNLRQLGFVRLRPPGPRNPNPEPVRVEGKPLSETVLEERRYMPVYFLDTSALLKRYVVEVGTPWIQGLVGPPFTNQVARRRSVRRN